MLTHSSLLRTFGNVVIDTTHFINATQGAMYFLITDDYFSPNQITIQNCVFQDNKSPSKGAAITFQGAKTKRFELLNALIINTTFVNNQAQGMLLISFCRLTQHSIWRSDCFLCVTAGWTDCSRAQTSQATLLQ